MICIVNNTFSKVFVSPPLVYNAQKQNKTKIKKQIVYIILKNNYNNVVIKRTMWKAKS